MVGCEIVGVETARQWLGTGSDLVVVPYSSIVNPNGVTEMSTFTRLAVDASTVLYHDGGMPGTTVIPVGEHTFGPNATSTTKLMKTALAEANVPTNAMVTQEPVLANSTPEQLAWLQKHFAYRWSEGPPPVFVSHAPHHPRLQLLCGVYGLAALLVDAPTVLERAGKLHQQDRRAAELYQTQNAQYEHRAMQLTKCIAWAGPAATTHFFRAMSRMRSATVVDVSRQGDRTELYATSARQHLRSLASEA